MANEEKIILTLHNIRVFRKKTKIMRIYNILNNFKVLIFVELLELIQLRQIKYLY